MHNGIISFPLTDRCESHLCPLLSLTPPVATGEEVVPLPLSLILTHCYSSFTNHNISIAKKNSTFGMGKRSIMGEQLGLLKVIVVQGKRLVIRDFKTSDPYVVLKLGNQTAKTKVINSCLNPVWNEELNFTLTEPLGVLNLEVFDKDLLKADDKMGNAFLNLQPIVSAARLRDILRVSSGETTLRKVIPDGENCLVRESSINCVNGEVVQNVWLRLRGVESGELELTIKLVTHVAPAI
ncbi:Protein C2-DOMAIN ABA-RELATED 11 isoform B [Glycine soja]|uniref:Protein C2-DOMAIN ABA-RELATED 11 isoform B n=1 Tax=Glycine soja TaxID=3848 RepID=A0A445GSB7_GLYSO|nr:Protein C2-DOMAIN ABA-RELATED 11 isoform B [Glycine soja]